MMDNRVSFQINDLNESDQKKSRNTIGSNSKPDGPNSKTDVFIIMNNNSKVKYIPSLNVPDVVHSFKYFLIFGRVIGVIPLTGLWKGRAESLKFKWKSGAGFTTIFISILLAFCTIIGIIGFFKSQKQNANELAWSAHLSVFYATGFFIYVYFLLYSQEFLLLLTKWKHVKLHYQTVDTSLKRHVNLVAGILFTSIILENITWHFKHFFENHLSEIPPDENENETNNSTTASTNLVSKIMQSSLEQFYENSEPEWSMVFEYHPAFAIFVIVTNKWALYSWNYFDILIIVMSRAIFFKFRVLNQKAEEYLADTSFSKDPSKWKEFMDDHFVLTDLLSSCQHFLSPIIFVSYCVNIYNVCIHLSLGLSPAWNTTTIGSVYAIWAFAHLTIRLYLVSISAAKINEHALNICKVLKKCPIELYDKETEKFERQLCNNDIGLGGLGYFTITKSFMLRILGVIFTVEIVLLQNPVKSPSFGDGSSILTM